MCHFGDTMCVCSDSLIPYSESQGCFNQWGSIIQLFYLSDMFYEQYGCISCKCGSVREECECKNHSQPKNKKKIHFCSYKLHFLCISNKPQLGDFNLTFFNWRVTTSWPKVFMITPLCENVNQRQPPLKCKTPNQWVQQCDERKEEDKEAWKTQG